MKKNFPEWKNKLCQDWTGTFCAFFLNFFKEMIWMLYYSGLLMFLFFSENLCCPQGRKYVRIIMASVLCFPIGSTVRCTVRFRRARLSFQKAKHFHCFQKLWEELLFVMPVELLYVTSNYGSSSSLTNRCKFFCLPAIQNFLFFFGDPLYPVPYWD